MITGLNRKTDALKVQWAATCITCGIVLDKAPNGSWVEAVAQAHKETSPRHSVWVGYEVTEGT